MKRIHPHALHDVGELSALLDQLLKILSYDTGIPESIFRRLTAVHRHGQPDPEVSAQDYHILFANILFRFPTLRMFKTSDGKVFFKY
jgi:hypothetical protein